MKSEIRKTISLPKTIWKAISDYRFDNRLKTEAEALRRILKEALDV
jgi:hypothetical protein